MPKNKEATKLTGPERPVQGYGVPYGLKCLGRRTLPGYGRHVSENRAAVCAGKTGCVQTGPASRGHGALTPDNARPVIRMTYRQSRKVYTLIHRLCANCLEGNCLLLDDGETTGCPQALTFSLCCTYFKAAVLPAEPALYTEIMEKRYKKNCVLCGTDFYPAFSNTRYCTQCGKIQARLKAAERQRRKRANVTLSESRKPDV